MSKQVTFQCPACGSSNVYGTAFTQWDDVAQKWIIESTDDMLCCEDCDMSDVIDPISWQVELQS